MNKEIIIENLKLDSLASEVSKLIPLISKYKLVFLYGNLGAGKTTISSEIIKQLTNEEDVTSPTFNILQIYEGNGCEIFHYDLYRVKNFEEIYEIGLLENSDNNICIIEWPEIIETYFSHIEKLEIRIDIISSDTRKLICKIP